MRGRNVAKIGLGAFAFVDLERTDAGVRIHAAIEDFVTGARLRWRSTCASTGGEPGLDVSLEDNLLRRGRESFAKSFSKVAPASIFGADLPSEAVRFERCDDLRSPSAYAAESRVFQLASLFSVTLTRERLVAATRGMNRQ